jgi:hypothetical protein
MSEGRFRNWEVGMRKAEKKKEYIPSKFVIRYSAVRFSLTSKPEHHVILILIVVPQLSALSLELRAIPSRNT